ncbi:MAG: hypothetical protein KDA53_11165 [Hyphomonas sp.]|nr:hypothetical protein [Hyphomonas sp.]
MARRKNVLPKLVALKRQQAEQEFYTARKAHEAAEDEAGRLARALKGLDAPEADIESTLLSLRYGHDRKLLADMQENRAEAAEKRGVMDEARETLKRALNSEDQIRKMS